MKTLLRYTFSITLLIVVGSLHAQNNWDQIIKTVSSTRSGFPFDERGSSDGFGISVAIDGNYAVVGIPFEDKDASGNNPLQNAGSAYFYDQAALPSVTATGTLTSFSACSGSVSAEQTFTISGSDLTADITVTAPTGFETSTSSGTGFGTSVSLTQSGGSVASTTIYVRMASTATGTPSGNLTCSSTGATDQTVAVSGTVNALPTVAFTSTLSQIDLDAGVQTGISGGSPTGVVQNTTDNILIDNVSFVDGGVATGHIDFDVFQGNSSTTSSDFSVSVSGGNTSNFPSLTYDQTNSTATLTGGPNIITIIHTATNRRLYLPVTFNMISGQSLGTRNLNPTAKEDFNGTAPSRAATGSFTFGQYYETTGVYSGPGVTDRGGSFFFDPATAGLGTHTITYTFANANGCSSSATDEIEVVPSCDIAITSSTPTAETCLGANDGEIAVIPTCTACTSIEYSIDDFATAPNTTGTFTGLAGGTYTVKVRDSGDAGCTAEQAGVVVPSGPVTPAILFDDAASTTEDTPIASIDILANDQNTNCGTDRTIILLESGSKGISVVNPDNTISYTPDANAAGCETIKYAFADPITGLTANNDIALTAANTLVSIDVTGNDTDPQNDPLSVAILNNPTNGTAVLNGNNIDYTPSNGFSGTDVFTYEINDGNGNTAQATVQVVVGGSLTSGLVHYLPEKWNSKNVSRKSSALWLSTEGPGNATVNVTTLAGYNQTFTVTPNVTNKIPLYTDNLQVNIAELTTIGNRNSFNSIGNNGIKVVSNIPINAQIVQEGGGGQSFLHSKSTDALGTEFYVAQQGKFFNGTTQLQTYENNGEVGTFPSRSVISVMAIENNTSVTFTTPPNTTWNWAGTTLSTVSVTLNEGESYLISSDNVANNLTGAKVVSDKPIAVSSGSFGLTYNPGTDNGWEQTVPVSKLGIEYVVFKSSGNSNPDEAYVVATENNTTVSVNGQLKATINEGQFYILDLESVTIATNSPHYISTSKPAYVYNCTGKVGGEPGLTVIAPLNVNGKGDFRFRTTVLGSTSTASVVLITSTSATSSVSLQDLTLGQPVSIPSWTPISARPEISFATIELDDATEFYLSSAAFSQIFMRSAGNQGGGIAYIGGFSNTLFTSIPDQVLAVVDFDMTFNPLANDTDPAGGTISITNFTQPDHGTIVKNGDDTFTYTPDVGYSGADGFSYTISNGAGLFSTSNVTFDVQALSVGTLNIDITPVADNPGISIEDGSGNVNNTISLTINTTGSSDTDGSETLDNAVISGVPASVNFSAGTNNNDGTWTLTPAQLAGLTATGTAGGTFNLTLTVNVTDEVTDCSNTQTSNSDAFIDQFSLTLIHPCDLTISSVTPTAETCPGENDGSISAVATCSACSGIEYSIDDFATFNTTGTFTGLADGTYTVKVRDSGDAGCNATESNVVVAAGVDNTPPVVTCQAFTLVLDNSGNGTLAVNDVLVSATDNCGIATSVLSKTNFTSADVGTNNVTMTVTDVNGNQNTCVAVVTVELSCDIAITSATPTDETCPGADNGEITVIATCNTCTSIEYSIDDFATAPNTTGIFTGLADGTYTVKVRDSGDAGCNTTESNVIVAAGVDNTLPVVTCQAFTLVLDNNGNGTLDVNDVLASATDNCGIATSVLSKTNFNSADVGTNNVTVTVTDVNGNQNTCVAVVTVELSCDIAITSVTPTAETCPGANDGQIIVVATCTTCTSIEYSIDDFATFNTTGTFTGLADGTYTVKVRDSGDAGCNATESNVVVAAGVDTEAPTFIDESIISLFDNNFETPLITPVDGTDNFKDVSIQQTVTQLFGSAFLQRFTVETLLNNGSNNVYSDNTGQAGNYSLGIWNSGGGSPGGQDDLLGFKFNKQGNDYLNVQFDLSPIGLSWDGTTIFVDGIHTSYPDVPEMRLVVYDNPLNNFSITNPNASTIIAQDTVVGLPSSSPFTYNWKTVTAGLDVSAATNENIVIVFDLLGRGKAYAAIDNFIINSANSSIENTLPADITIQCLSDLPAVPIVTAFDNCDNDVSVTFAQNPETPTGNDQTITRTWTATDNSGNTASGVQTITVDDVTAPTIAAPVDIILVANNNTCDGVDSPALGSATTSDNCSSNITVSNDAPGTFPLGTTKVYWTANDGNGNIKVDSQLVTVVKPEINIQGNSEDIASGDITPNTTDHTDFGGTDTETPIEKTFTIQNLGTSTLNLASTNQVTLTGDSEFSVLQQPSSSTIANGGSDLTFIIRYTPTTAGTHSAIVNITSDDCNEATYTFAISGSAVLACDIAITSATPTDETCPGADNGEISVVATCTTCASIEYSIDDFATAPNTTGIFTGLVDGTYTVKVRDSGDVGCIATQSNVIVSAGVDNTPPIAVCPASQITLYLDAAGTATLAANSLGDGSSTDNCGTVTETNPLINFSCENIGANTVVLTATDGNGNIDTVHCTVTVLDTISPTITCPTDVTVYTEPGLCTATLADYTGDASATDNCGAPNAGSSSTYLANTYSEGSFHGMGVAADGSLWLWGFDGFGQFGDGPANGTSLSPIQVGTDIDWSAVFAGEAYSIALKENGTLYGWGQNNGGQAGNGTFNTVNTISQIGSDTDWTKVSAGYNHNLAIKSNGTLWAWGTNIQGQLGDGTISPKATPVQIGTDTDWDFVSAGFYHSLAIKTDGSLWAWGWNADGRLGTGGASSNSPVQVGTDTDWSFVSAGNGQSHGIKDNGTLWAWGWNFYGQLGDGTNTDRYTPVQIGTAIDWVSVSGGEIHSIALKSNGTAWATGSNDEGQLGNGTNNSSNSFVLVSNITDWSSVTTKTYSNVGQRSNGELYSWGRNQGGALGDGSSVNKDTPVPLSFTANSPGNAGSGFVITQSPAAGSSLALGTNTITLSTTDASGNTSLCTFNVTVEDNIPPTLVGCPATATFTIDLCNEKTINADSLGITATDNCGTPTITLSQYSFTTPGTYTVTVTATDDATLTSTCSVEVTIVENPNFFTISLTDDQIDACVDGSFTFTAASLLANDNTSNNSVLEVQEVSLTNPSDGTLTDNGNGNFTFTPANGVTGNVSLTYLAKAAGEELYFEPNGHYYEYVAAPGISWTAAKAAAEVRTLYGQSGYLATITSQEENGFVFSKLQGEGWLGGKEINGVNGGDWRWVTGPEALVDNGNGLQFWDGNIGGVAISGVYQNWISGEPNNYQNNEEYLHMRTTGKWNDFPIAGYSNSGDQIAGYFVEYGGIACTPNFAATANITINVQPKPSITNIATQVNTCPSNVVDLATLTITDDNSVAGTTTTFHSQVPQSATDVSNELSILEISSDQKIYVMVANATTGCYDVDSFMVDITICCDIAIASVTPTVETCPGADDGQISVTASCTYCTGIEYSIDDFATSNTTGLFTGLTDGTYTVKVRDTGNALCTSEQTNIVLNAGVDIIAPVINCPTTKEIALDFCGETILTAEMLDVTATDNCIANPTLSLSQTNFSGVGTNTVTVFATDGTNQSSCDVAVTFVNQTVSLTNNGPVCEGESITFTATPMGANLGYAFFKQQKGSTNSGNSISFYDPSNTYTTSDIANGDIWLVLVSDGSGCTVYDTSLVHVNPRPVVSLNLSLSEISIFAGIQTGIIGGNPVSNTQTIGVYAGIGVTDQNGTFDFDPSIAGIGTHSITYTFTDENGCTNTATDEILVTNNIIFSVSPTDTLLCPNQTLTLNSNGCTGTVSWDDGVSVQTGASLTINLTVSTVYQVNCSLGGSKQVAIHVIENNVQVIDDINTGTEVIKAVQTLTSDKKVGIPAVDPKPYVSFQAGNSITLEPGFETISSSVFKAEIKTCPE
ncbi:tandem-95 repeat protein [Lacihabitans sp. LS3-19]|uniref:Ig-like domain-containing protein n=1 Tax=Lacihabitans sp. LS3-19 TaxID=2487335 RepID=UPI0020CF922C|nr:cadherin-like domain-containing protein [Lacihabitans sp. LS3-19]MCP9767157.1 tandem-95 repeat protein [Lacihabitans sp. LS3-19]